jgi:hypothetical protein
VSLEKIFIIFVAYSQKITLLKFKKEIETDDRGQASLPNLSKDVVQKPM